jgi:response regulator of citrate/malate metabolism
MEKIRGIQLAQKTISTQINALSKLSDIIKTNPQNSIIYTHSNKILEDTAINFKTIADSINEFIQKDTLAQSHTYFDGIIGAIPLDYEDLQKEVDNSKQKYEKVNEHLTEVKKSISNATIEQIRANIKQKEANLTFENSILKNFSTGFTSTQSNNILGSNISNLL